MNLVHIVLPADILTLLYKKTDRPWNTHPWRSVYFLSLIHIYTDNHEKYLKKTIPVEHGKFKLEGMISEPTNVFLCLDSTINRMDDPNLTNFWIEATDMHLEITLGAFKQFKLSGSKTNDEEQELNRQQAPCLLYTSRCV